MKHLGKKPPELVFDADNVEEQGDKIIYSDGQEVIDKLQERETFYRSVILETIEELEDMDNESLTDSRVLWRIGQLIIKLKISAGLGKEVERP